MEMGDQDRSLDPLILVVDDDITMRTMISETLKQGGFNVVTAIDGLDALEKSESLLPDMVLLDVSMPRLNGIDTCARLRRKPRFESIPVVMVTGCDDLQSISRAYEAGATDFITKPFRWMILIERIRYILRASRGFEELKESKRYLEDAQRIARLGNWVFDAASNRLTISGEAHNILGLKAGNGQMTFDEFIELVHPDDAELVQSAFQRWVTVGEALFFDHRVILSDRTVRYVSQQAESAQDLSKNSHALFGTILDITDRKRMEQVLAKRNSILKMVIEGKPLPDILDGVVRLVRFQFPKVSVYLSLASEDKLFTGASIGVSEELLSKIDGVPISPKSGCLGAAAYLGQTVTVPDVHHSHNWSKILKGLENPDFSSTCSLPFFSGKGQVLGAMTIFCPPAYRLTQAELLFFEMTGQLCSVALEQHYMVEKLLHQATHDPLTRLPNRALLADRLETAIKRCSRYGERVALLCVDLDRFKHINDSFGHHFGDHLLRLVADRLDKCARESDTLARMGGDEFMFLMIGISEPQDAACLASRILDVFSAPFFVEKKELHTTASIGISLWPDDGQDAGTLQKSADMAMYTSKNEGGNRYSFFVKEMSRRVIERMEVENELRKALERNQFELHYQPQYELNSGDLVGLEALIRWNHPEMGRIPPGKFIPIAEESGVILSIGKWVLEEACKQNMEWQKQGFGPVRVSVNVAAVQFAQEDFVKQVIDTMRRCGLSPQWLELEVTESSLLGDMELIAQRLAELRDFGISIAIDDFGTGYSAMAYLQKLPVDCLKIDRSFVFQLNSPDYPTERSIALIESFVKIGQSLGLKVVAEGVEDLEQKTVLNHAGCDIIQGFFLAEPMPSQEVRELLTKGSIEVGSVSARPASSISNRN